MTGSATSATVRVFCPEAMLATSGFTPLNTELPVPSTGWRDAAAGALEGLASNVPLSLGCATLVFSRIGGGYLASGVMATMLALVWMHTATIRNRRPLLYSARI